jgi:hypothetical protein
MGVLDVIGWSFVAAVTAWVVTLSWARLELAHSRTVLQDDIRYWHAEAIKARDLAAQLKLEIDTWSRGCQQGREDVIAIMPLLIAAQKRFSGAALPETPLVEASDR